MRGQQGPRGRGGRCRGKVAVAGLRGGVSEWAGSMRPLKGSVEPGAEGRMHQAKEQQPPSLLFLGGLLSI